MFVIPSTATLNLRRAAAACGEKAVEMIPQKQLLPSTGYIHGGCSPVGMKKAYVTRIDASAQGQRAIFVSAGRIGQQMEVNPEQLAQVCGAEFADITQ